MVKTVKNNDAKKIVYNVLWMIFDKVFMLIMNLLVTVQVANHFGAMEYGSYQYAVNVVAIFEILVTFVDSRVVKSKYYHYSANTVVFAANISRILFSIISGIIGVCFILFFSNDMKFSAMFIILLLNTIIINVKAGMANRFEFLLMSKKIVVASDLATVIGAIMQLMAVRFDWSIIVISLIALFTSIMNVLIVYIQYKWEFKERLICKFDRKLFKSMIRQSVPLAIAASCATIYTRCDSVMIGMLMTTAEVGVYSISLKLISVVQIALSPVRESVYPKLIALYNTDKTAYQKMYIRVSSMLTWMYIIGVAFSFFILPFLFRFLNAEYAEAFPIYKIYVLGTFFMYNAALRAGHYTMINKGNILMYTQLFSLVLNVILNYVGISWIGVYGAAIATIITQGLSLMISNLFFGQEGRDVFKWQIKALNPVNIFIK